MNFFIDVGAVTMAGFAVWYAQNAVGQASRQNDIAQFEKRIGIYHALGKFRVEVATKGPLYPEDALWEFESASQLNEFYFPREIAVEFARISSNAIEHMPSTTPTQNMTLYGRTHNVIDDINHRTLRDDCIKLSENVRRHLIKLAGSSD